MRRLLSVVFLGAVALSTRANGVSAELSDDDGVFPNRLDEALAEWYTKDGRSTNVRDAVYAEIVGSESEVSSTSRRRGFFGKMRGGGAEDARATVAREKALTVDWGNEAEEWALAMQLIKERSKGDASRFHPFIESLYAHTPAAASRLSERARQRLKGHSALAVFKKYDATLEKGWKSAMRTVEAFPTIFSVSDFTRESFEDALSIVRANSFLLVRADGVPFRALVPMAHLIPHDTRSSVPCVELVEDEYLIRVDRHDEGEELTCSHGNYSDAETFARFGTSALYSSNKNPWNKISFELPEGMDGVSAHLVHCGSLGNIGFTANGATEELMCALRLISANATELKRVTDSEARIRSLRKKPISEESEIAVYDALFATLTELLDSYPSSDSIDENILKSKTLLEDERRAVNIRLREKRDALNSFNEVQFSGRQTLGAALYDKHFGDLISAPTKTKDEL